MKEIKIYSENAAFQKFEVLRSNRVKRYRYGEFLVEGVLNINAAVKYGWEISSFIYTGERKLSGWAAGLLQTVKTSENFVLTDALMAGLSGKTDTSELLAVVRMRADDYRTVKLSDQPVILLFDRPSNRGNLGTVLRSCDALGVELVVITGHAVDLYDPEVVAASMGSLFTVPAVRVAENEAISGMIADLRAKYPDFRTVATTAHREHAIWSAGLRPPLLLMLGNETDGLCRSLYEAADLTVTIPMAESSFATSFNAACAATVMLYEIARQKAL
jgi:TrmH family RNA methyltransferase